VRLEGAAARVAQAAGWRRRFAPVPQIVRPARVTPRIEQISGIPVEEFSTGSATGPDLRRHARAPASGPASRPQISCVGPRIFAGPGRVQRARPTVCARRAQGGSPPADLPLFRDRCCTHSSPSPMSIPGGLGGALRSGFYGDPPCAWPDRSDPKAVRSTIRAWAAASSTNRLENRFGGHRSKNRVCGRRVPAGGPRRMINCEFGIRRPVACGDRFIPQVSGTGPNGAAGGGPAEKPDSSFSRYCALIRHLAPQPRPFRCFAFRAKGAGSRSSCFGPHGNQRQRKKICGTIDGNAIRAAGPFHCSWGRWGPAL